MRTVTRNLLLGIAVVGLFLLALGAVPSLLKSGDPYYVSATPVGDANGSTERAAETATPAANATAINASALSQRTFPYTTGAVAAADPVGNRTGYSEPYWRGPTGFKEAFTHSPFDELASLGQRNPGATDGDIVRLVDNGTLYRVGVTQSRP